MDNSLFSTIIYAFLQDLYVLMVYFPDISFSLFLHTHWSMIPIIPILLSNFSPPPPQTLALVWTLILSNIDWYSSSLISFLTSSLFPPQGNLLLLQRIFLHYISDHVMPSLQNVSPFYPLNSCQLPRSTKHIFNI